MATFTYHHTVLNQTYKISTCGKKTLADAWAAFDYACKRNGWSEGDADLIKVAVINA